MPDWLLVWCHVIRLSYSHQRSFIACVNLLLSTFRHLPSAENLKQQICSNFWAAVHHEEQAAGAVCSIFTRQLECNQYL